MPLSVEKLRILTFPQRIVGRTLDLHVLLLPTQRLLNVLAPFPSQLNPGTTVELPRFIQADLQLVVDAIGGLGSYPFSNAAVLAADGPRSRRGRPARRSHRICPRCTRGWPRSSRW
jgi:hypothetical protein